MKHYESIHNLIDSNPAIEDFMDSFATVLQEVQEYEPIEAEDIINYLRIRMSSCPLVKNQYYI